MEQLLVWLDPFFVLPYRMVPQPEAAYFLGTAILALVAGLIGIATLRMAQRMHRKRLKKLQDDMRHYHELSESALQNSGKEAFKAVNRQGHEAFGYYFSLSNALFVASLWPAPIMLAWMQLRFGTISPSCLFLCLCLAISRAWYSGSFFFIFRCECTATKPSRAGSCATGRARLKP